MRHKGTLLAVEVGQYLNGQHCIKLFDSMNKIPYAVATVAIELELKKDEVAIKDYSENEGILRSLIMAGIIHEPHKFYSSGFVQIPISKLTPYYLEVFGIDPAMDTVPADHDTDYRQN